jgi:hypothetical protein
LCLAALAVCLDGAAPAAANELPIVTGNEWVASTEREQTAYLLGMATIIDIEQEVQGMNPEFAEHTLIDTWVKGLSPYTITELREKIDVYYASNPGELDTPVVEVLWKEFVLDNAYE